MQCPECGAKVGADERFCGNCGARLQDIELTSPAEGETSLDDEATLSEPPPLPTQEPAALPSDETVLSEAPAPPIKPVVPPPPPPPVIENRSGDKTGLIIAIVILVLLLLCCCCVLVFIALNSETISEDLGDWFALAVPTLTAMA